MNVSQGTDKKQFYQPAVDTISLILGLPACIWLADEARSTLKIVAATGLSEEYICKASLCLDEPSVAAKVLETGKTIVVPDIASDGRWKYRAEAAAMELKSAIVVPLRVKEKIVGVFDVYTHEVREFSELEKVLIEKLAAQVVASTIRNTHLFEQATNRAEALQKLHQIGGQILSAEFSAQGLEKVLRQVAQSAKGVLDADLVDVYRYVEAENRWVLPPVMEGERRDTTVPKNHIFDDDVVVKVIEDGKPIYIPDAQSASLLTGEFTVKRPQRPEKRFVVREGILSSAAVPLRSADETVGVMFVNYRRRQAFAPDQKNIIELFANQAAMAIYNAELFRQTRERLEQRQILSEISNLLMEQRDVHEVLKLLMQKTLDSFDVDQGSFWSVDYAHHCVDLRFSIDQDGNLSDWYQKEAKVSIPIGPGSIIGNVAVTGIPELWNDVDQCLYWDPKFDEETGYVTKRVLTVPILREQRATGVIQIVNPVEDSDFTDDEQEFLMSIASMAAIALHNAEMHEREMALSDIGRKLTEGSYLHEQEILQLIYQQAGRLMDADNMYIALYDEAIDTVRFGLAFKEGKPIKVATRKAGKGRTEEIIRTKKPIFTATEMEAGAWYAQPGHKEYIGDSLASWLGVPMMVGEKVLGVIATYHPTRDHVYSKDDLTILQTLANQAAIALDNARLYYDVNQRLQMLVNVGQKFSSGIQLKESGILKLIYEQAQELTGTRDMYVALYDEDTKVISFELAMDNGEPVEVGIGGWATRKANMEERGKTEEIIFAGKPILHSTLQESQDRYKHPGRQEFLGRVQASYLGVPMNTGDKILGVLAIYDWEREYAYSESDLAILSSMASQAAIALDNAILYQKVEKRRGQLEAVRKITNAIATELDLQVCMERILDETITLLKAHYAIIQLLDEATDELVIHAQRGVEGREFTPALHRIKIGEGITGVAAQEKRTIRVGNVGDVKYYLDYIEGTQSEMATPLIQHGKVIGVLNVEDTSKNAFDQDDADLFELLAEEVVIAIQNAALFEEKDLAIRSLREAQKKNIAAGRLTVVNTMAAGFVHRMNNIAGTIPVRVEQIRELLDPSDVNYTKMVGYLGVIDQDVDGLLKTAQAIKASKTEEPLELVDVGTLVSTALQRIVTPSRITVCNRCDGNLPQVLVLSGQLVDTLENLIRNGIEAIEGSGAVTITCGALVKDSQKWVIVGIEDTGHGISPTDMDRIFDLFYSTKPGGMGFALWRARTLVESLGGRIEVSSEPGKGTTFTILLPVERELWR